MSDDGSGGEVLFETERLLLRRFRREDLKPAAAINADPRSCATSGPMSCEVTEEHRDRRHGRRAQPGHHRGHGSAGLHWVHDADHVDGDKELRASLEIITVDE